MCDYNPIERAGVERFVADAKVTGIDGRISVDVPPEEDEELCLPALKSGLHWIRLATPTTDDNRLPTVLNNTSGFVYYVSILGITGTAAVPRDHVRDAVARLRRHTATPSSEERRGGRECVRTCRYRGSPSPSKNTTT